MGIMWALGPVIGPVIGGYLQFYFNWQAGFWFFSIVAFISFIALTIIVPETHFNGHPLNFSKIKSSIFEVVTHKIFMALVILMGCAYSLIIVFNTMGPFFIQNTLGHSPIFFGRVAFWLGIIFLSAAIICRYFLKKYPVDKLYQIAINLFFAIAILALISAYFFEKSLILAIGASACMYFVASFVFPMSAGKVLSLFRHISGAAGAVMYLINVLITSFSAFLCGFIHTNTIIPMMWLNASLLFICCVAYWKVLAGEV